MVCSSEVQMAVRGTVALPIFMESLVRDAMLRRQAGAVRGGSRSCAEWYGVRISRPSTALPGGCVSKSTTRLSRLPNTAS